MGRTSQPAQPYVAMPKRGRALNQTMTDNINAPGEEMKRYRSNASILDPAGTLTGNKFEASRILDPAGSWNGSRNPMDPLGWFGKKEPNYQIKGGVMDVNGARKGGIAGGYIDPKTGQAWVATPGTKNRDQALSDMVTKYYQTGEGDMSNPALARFADAIHAMRANGQGPARSPNRLPPGPPGPPPGSPTGYSGGQKAPVAAPPPAGNKQAAIVAALRGMQR